MFEVKCHSEKEDKRRSTIWGTTYACQRCYRKISARSSRVHCGKKRKAKRTRERDSQKKRETDRE